MSQNRDGEVIVACHALEAEINHLQETTGIVRRVIWVDRGLHNFPDQLKAAIQEVFDSIEDAHTVLMGYGNCGNALQGVTTGDFTAIIPNVDDCISILLGSKAARQEYSAEHAAFFLTEGWMDADHSIVQEYNYSVNKYGQEMADNITSMIYAHYRTMAYLDTGLYDIEALMDTTRHLCEVCEMKQIIEPVSIEYVEHLLTGPWDNDRFLHVAPHSKIPRFG